MCKVKEKEQSKKERKKRRPRELKRTVHDTNASSKRAEEIFSATNVPTVESVTTTICNITESNKASFVPSGIRIPTTF